MSDAPHIDCASGECETCWQFYEATSSPATAPYIRNASKGYRIAKNAYYTVFVLPMTQVIHLSIKRNDKEAIHDWRHFQRIKNMIVDPEAEAVELYPAESRLVDNANQYHLFCTRPGEQIPLGFFDRLVTKGGDSPSGAKQRPFPAWAEPADALNPEETEAMAKDYFSRQEHSRD